MIKNKTRLPITGSLVLFLPFPNILRKKVWEGVAINARIAGNGNLSKVVK